MPFHATSRKKIPLEWTDLDLAPLDRRAGHLAVIAELQRKGALGEFRVLDVHRLLAVEFHRELRALGGDEERVPLAAGLVGRRYRHLGEVDDRGGAVFRPGTLIVDV